MGDHTDYNGGLVVPVAIEQNLSIQGHARPDEVRLTSDRETTAAVVPLSGGPLPSGWGRYVAAVVCALREMDLAIRGFEGAVRSTLPSGAGLSSSAALEVAVALALLAEDVDGATIARACHRAENVYVGVPCGVMDQMAVALCRERHALLIDCRTETFEYVPIGDDFAVLVVESGVQRDLQQSGYAERVKESRAVAAALGIDSLRDATEDLLRAYKKQLGNVLYRRVRHVVTENERVIATPAALIDKDRPRIRELFDESHASLRDDYEVSTPEVDTLQRCALDTEGVIGARLTGGGFGGCIVALIERDGEDAIAEEVSQRYAAVSGREVRAWMSSAAGGARRL
jgi:galactokinase